MTSSSLVIKPAHCHLSTLCPQKGATLFLTVTLTLCAISFNEEIVLHKLEKLRDDKAAGADELVPRF